MAESWARARDWPKSESLSSKFCVYLLLLRRSATAVGLTLNRARLGQY